MSRFDYIIVGAGSAGCVLANRLSANPDIRVCLLEAGGSNRSPLLHVPAGWAATFGNSKFDWGFQTEPEPELNNRQVLWPRGKALGGSSAINGMIYVRGVPLDFAAWEQAGAKGEADPQAGQNQRDGGGQGFRNGVERANRTIRHRHKAAQDDVRLDRCCHHDQGADQKRHEDRGERDQDDFAQIAACIDCRGQQGAQRIASISTIMGAAIMLIAIIPGRTMRVGRAGHAAAVLLAPAMASPMAPRSACDELLSNSAVICPSYIT